MSSWLIDLIGEPDKSRVSLIFDAGFIPAGSKTRTSLAFRIVLRLFFYNFFLHFNIFDLNGQDLREPIDFLEKF